LKRHEALALFAGGAAGALIRVGLSDAYEPASGQWPWVTLAVNLLGAVLLGFVVARAGDAPGEWEFRHPLLGPGLCGALTTFSTLQLELLGMLDAGHAGLAVGYAGASAVLGAAAAAAGWALGRMEAPA
jgi:CrcB protein